MTRGQRLTLTRIIISGLMVIALIVLPKVYPDVYKTIPEQYMRFLYLVPYLLVGWDVIVGAIKGLFNLKFLGEKFLMVIATIGAFLIGEYPEAVCVMIFYQLGELFEDYAVDKSKENIAKLMDIRPDYANVYKDGKLEQVNPEEVLVGTTIVVKPGEKIPIDGFITKGQSSIDTTALTGESEPYSCKEGDDVISGSINVTGLLEIETTKEFSESTVSRIIEMAQTSSDKKAKSERFISKFAKVYTPIVCALAVIIAVGPPLVRMAFMHLDPDWMTWIYRALICLVISCPCALVMSIPLGFFAGIGGASHEGILIKGSNYMETLANAKHIVFDKTGTLTHGVFKVNGIHHSKFADAMLLEYAALAEAHSSHPISASLKAECPRHGEHYRVKDVEEFPGKGVKATVDGRKIAVGNETLMREEDIDYIPCSHVGTVVHVAIDGEYGGHILIKDEIKPTTEKAIKLLKKLGIKDTVILSGDKKANAEEVAEKIGVDRVYSELLPDEKVIKLEEIIDKKKPNESVVFVGDGVNDAPTLARADVGVAMGALGSDAAIEAADVVLMDDDPRKLPKAIRIAKRTLRIVKENIYFAIGVKVLCLILGTVGLANMWLAIFADVGVMIIAVANAIRAIIVRDGE